METIRNYLETMFQNMPNTPNVLKAKQELYSMMEDKYNGLIAEGMSEADAIAKVISECGSIEDIAGELGIEKEFETQQENERTTQGRTLLPEPMVMDFIFDMKRYSMMLALAVTLFVASTAFVVLFSLVDLALLGVIVMFLLIAAGVFVIVMCSQITHRWNFLKHTPCQIDYPVLAMINERYTAASPMLTLLMAVGIMLCILSVIPVIISGYLADSGIGAFFMLLMIAIGVGLIVGSATMRGAFKTLFAVNDRQTVGGNQFNSQKNMHYADPAVDFIMSVYWQTVTCAYLSWSFLTFKWGFTWIIWPVAGILWGILKSTLRGGQR